MGEGQDTKLVNSRDVRVSLNRPRVVKEVSKALGEDVARQLAEQLGGGYQDPDQAELRNTCQGMKRRRFCARARSQATQTKWELACLRSPSAGTRATGLLS